MEQQQTKLPLEWLSSRRTPELHRLEQLCRETAREHRCAQRRLQEVEEAMASEREKSCPEALPAASGPTQLEQLSRKLNAANAELRRLFDAGKLTFRSHVFDGLDQAIPALNALFEGTNIGKTFLRP